MTVIFTGSWNDPVKERAAAQALVDQGADVIGQHVDTPDAADRRAGARRLRHRPPPRPERIRAQGHAVLVGLGVGQVPRAGAQEDHGRQLEAEPVRRLLPDRGRRHRHRVLQRGGAEGRAAEVTAERDGDRRGQARLSAGPLKRHATARSAWPQGAVLSDADLWKMDWLVPGVVTQK